MTIQDTVESQALPDRPSRRLGETMLLALGLAALIAGELAICKPRIIYDGPFVLDECLTDSIVRDPSIAHSIAAVRHGVDTNPPVFHLIERGFWALCHPLFHDSPRVALRAFATICTWLALVGVFVMLRRAFSRFVSLVGMLAVWAHPDVVEQSVNARFYAPLLLATVAMCLSLQIRGSGIVRGILIAVCAISLCTLHYFGILILGPIVLAMLLIEEAALSVRIIRVLPALAGPIALLPFISFVHTQAQGLSVKTWVDPFTFYQARQFLQDVLCSLPLAMVLAIWAIGQMRRRISSPVTSADRQNLRAACVPMLCLIAVPLVIVAFSAMVQSALISRYAIAASLSLAPLVAMLSQNTSRRALFITAILLSGLTVMELHGVASRRAIALRTLTDRSNELENEQPALPIVFADRADATELQRFSPDLLSRMSIVDQREPGVVLRDFRRYEIEMVGKVAAFYPTPPLITPAQMAVVGRFHLIAQPDDRANLLLELPMRHVGGDVYESLK